MSSPIRTLDLEAVIDAVVESYDGPEEINNLESAALPNKRAVVQAYNHLKPVIYMGFYSQRSLTRSNLRYALSEHLYPACEILVDQIGRALSYEERSGHVKAPWPSGWSEEVVLRLLRRLPELRRILNADITAAFEGDPAAKSVEEIVFSYPVVEAMTAHRIAHVLYSERVPIVPRIIAEYAHGLTGVDIHPGAQIGEGFFLDHGTGVVIGETSVIGRGVKMYQGVTLGALSTRRSECATDPEHQKRHPTIEDNVTIYAGATILGGDTVIGEGSVIGGNVWLAALGPSKFKNVGKGARVVRSKGLAGVAFGALLAVVVGCKPRQSAPQSAPLRVAAAADLARAFDELRPAFAVESPGDTTVTLGSTGLLARQIVEGAPFDLFLAANSSYVEQVVKAGACDGATEASYARGRLVIWVKGTGGAALTLASLGDARFKHIAIANPEHAPYGAAAREALTRAGTWSQLSERMVYGENVQQTLQLAQSGNADVAIVGLSLAIAAPSGSWSLVDEAGYTPIDQALVVCKHGSNPAAARKLAEFLGAPAGRAILRKYGFLRPGEALARAP